MSRFAFGLQHQKKKSGTKNFFLLVYLNSEDYIHTTNFAPSFAKRKLYFRFILRPLNQENLLFTGMLKMIGSQIGSTAKWYLLFNGFFSRTLSKASKARLTLNDAQFYQVPFSNRTSMPFKTRSFAVKILFGPIIFSITVSD